MLCIFTVGRINFKKLRRAASARINYGDEKHGGGRVWMENQTRQNRVL